MLHLGRDLTMVPTSAEWLTEWLAGRKPLEDTTARSYASPGPAPTSCLPRR
jgi:hypothetical protein